MNASGPLVARWLTVEHAPVEAGTLTRMTVEVENAGSAPWRTRGVEDGLFLSYHWLDERGNPIVWDGLRTPLGEAVEPGARVRRELVGARADSARPLPVRGRPRRGAPLLARRARQPAARGGRRRRAARCDRRPGLRRRAGRGVARARRRAPPRGLFGRRRRDRREGVSRTTHPAAGGTRASRTRSSARRSCRRSSRTPRSTGCRPTGRRATSRHVRRAARAQTSIAI